jgi:hypothetical protein
MRECTPSADRRSGEGAGIEILNLLISGKNRVLVIDSTGQIRTVVAADAVTMPEISQPAMTFRTNLFSLWRSSGMS